LLYAVGIFFLKLIKTTCQRSCYRSGNG